MLHSQVKADGYSIACKVFSALADGTPGEINGAVQDALRGGSHAIHDCEFIKQAR